MENKLNSTQDPKVTIQRDFEIATSYKFKRLSVTPVKREIYAIVIPSCVFWYLLKIVKKRKVNSGKKTVSKYIFYLNFCIDSLTVFLIFIDTSWLTEGRCSINVLLLNLPAVSLTKVS